MKISWENGNTYVEGISDFHLGQTLECGQCFHFVRLGDNEYCLNAGGRFLHTAQDKEGRLTLYGTTEGEFHGVWKEYFDLERDYGAIKAKLLSRDDRLLPAIQAMWGVRILNQDFFETMISFIISQNKQIPHIKRIVARLSESYGKNVMDASVREAAATVEEAVGAEASQPGVFYAFPTAERLLAAGEAGLREHKTGFRAPYILDACERYASGTLKEETLRSMSYEESVRALMSVKGIGEKVANCIALFSLGKRNAFPVDVWIKRTMENIYIGHEAGREEIQELAEALFGEYGGYAQQYLFYYGKEKGIGKKK